MEAPQYIRWFVKEFDIQLSDGTLLPCYRLEHTEDTKYFANIRTMLKSTPETVLT